MKDEMILDEMDLPLANPKEELETISNNQFRPLFDVTRFEIRSEDYRDKGIDFHIEIKKDGRYTNFRFAVQLKATEAKLITSDGSVNLQIHTSNINYLLNNAMPAFYVLYFKKSNTFYFQSLNDFVRKISEENPNWQKQKTHTIRFVKLLSPAAIQEIYDTTLQKGLFQRKVNERFIIQSASTSGTDKITIDNNYNVSSDVEIRKVIETAGQFYISKGEWKLVLDWHNRGSATIATTDKYNLVVGLAHYYSGDILSALNFFKAALKQEASLDPESGANLLFFYLACKLALGMLDSREYEREVSQLESKFSIGLYVKLDKLIATYHRSHEVGIDQKLESLIAAIKQLTLESRADEDFKTYAQCEVLLIEGTKNNLDYAQRTLMTYAVESASGIQEEMRGQVYYQFAKACSDWLNKVHALKQTILKRNNFFQYFTLVLNEVKTVYEMHVYSRVLKSVTNGTITLAIAETKTIAVFQNLLARLEEGLSYFRSIGHIENQIVLLVHKYELNHFIGEFRVAQEAFDVAEALIESHELGDKRRRLKNLKANGTSLERFQKWVKESLQEASSIVHEITSIIAEMETLDGLEKASIQEGEDFYTICLFPIGYFKFPRSQRDSMYEILNLKDPDVKRQFDVIFDMAIPVANIHYLEITQEGYMDGKLADKSVDGWRNIFRIRKALYDKGYYRTDLDR